MIRPLRPLAAQATVYSVIVRKESLKLAIKQPLLAAITIALDLAVASHYLPT